MGKVNDMKMVDPAVSEASRHNQSVSRLLHGARVTAGYELDDVAATLRIRKSYLQALESGSRTDLPGAAYAIGFVRTYAEYLGLDAADVVERFKHEQTGIDTKPELTFPAPVPENRMPVSVIVIVALVLAGLGYGGWYGFSATDRDLVETVTPPADRFAAVMSRVEEPAPALPRGAAQAGTPPVETLTSANLNAVGSSETAVGGIADEVEMAGAMSAMARTRPPVDQISLDDQVALDDGREIAAETPDPLISASSAPPPPPLSGTPEDGRRVGLSQGQGQEIVIRATGRSWVQVRDEGGRLLMTRILQAGDSYVVPQGDGLRLDTGNAGGLHIEYGGNVLPVLGQPGEVVRNIALDGEVLESGSTAN